MRKRIHIDTVGMKSRRGKGETQVIRVQGEAKFGEEERVNGELSITHNQAR